jgi:hypothetical protein
MDTGRLTGPITDEWVAHHFDRLSPELARELRRLTDIKLRPGADIEFHSTYNRAPLSVPITFSPRT